MVSGRGAADGIARRENSFLPDGHRLASGREKEIRALQHDAWETISASHAIAKGCYVCVPNRVDTKLLRAWAVKELNSGAEFRGGTSGQILAKAGPEKEETLIVPLDLKNVDTTRTHWPFLRDRGLTRMDGLPNAF